ncbi:MAG: HlyD family efflux transporter periplasmic adaptor subunit [Planctomycetia bacterium]|nr:HlyD family efflux transporter periplasmic adaptor subunit [Planctomycetia bacterium]
MRRSHEEREEDAEYRVNEADGPDVSGVPGRLLSAIRFLMPVLVLIGSVAVAMAFVGMKAPPKQFQPEVLIPLVATSVVSEADAGLEIRNDGVVVPYREITVASEVSGRILEKSELCRAGRFVTKGTKLVQIDPTDYELEVSRLAREIESAQNALDESVVEENNLQRLIELAKEDLELQESNLKRMETLIGSRAVSQEELETVQRAHVTAQTSLVSQENQLATLVQKRVSLETARQKAEIQHRQAKVDLDRTTIRAPIDGVVVTDCVEEDSYVSSGTTLFAVEDTSKVEVRSNLKASQIDWLWRACGSSDQINSTQYYYQLPPAKVLVSYTLLGRTYYWRGVLSRYDGIGLDRDTRTIPCRIEIPDPRELVDGVSLLTGDDTGTDAVVEEMSVERVGPPALLRGMYVSVTLQVPSTTKLLRVPENAVQPGGRVLRVVDGKIDIQSTTIVERAMGVVLVASEGLRPGDHVITSPISFAEQGATVREQFEEVSTETVAESSSAVSVAPTGESGETEISPSAV